MTKKIIFLFLFVFLLSGCTVNNRKGHTLLFSLDTKDNMQGLTYHDHHFYIGFDMGKEGEIREYSSKGDLIQSSGLLKIGHTASLAYRKKDNLIYEANGGKRNPAVVHVIDMKKGVVKTYNFSKFGTAALIAIDHRNEDFLLHTSYHHQMKFTFFSFDGKEKTDFTLPYQGVPQGLSIENGKIFYYTDHKILIINFKGNVLKVIRLKINGESEGLSVSGKFIYFGYHSPNRIYKIKKP